MDFIGEIVTHKKFGRGNIRSINGQCITIQFDDVDAEKIFVFPDAFEGFLVALNSDVDNELHRRFEEKKLAEQKEDAQKQSTKEALQRKHDALSVEEDSLSYSRLSRVHKQRERKNVAFKCTFCDGGKSHKQVGFAGVCSKAMIEYNIKVAKHTWCRDIDCSCRHYIEGEIKYNQIDADNWPCYESPMLIEWRAAAGVVQNGERRGQPIKMKDVRANSLCVLTTREPETPEEDRFVFGVFLVDEANEGDSNEPGYVSTESEFKLSLTPNEAHQILFWKYYSNENMSEKPFWGTGLFRYIDARLSAQILRDIAEVKRSTADEKLATRLLEYYCRINAIDLTTLPDPMGALAIGVYKK